AESLGLELLREIKSQLRDATVRKVRVLLNSLAAFDILNQFRKDLVRLEEAKGVAIEVRGDPAVPLSQIQVSTAKEGGEWILKKVSEGADDVSERAPCTPHEVQSDSHTEDRRIVE